MKLFNLSDYGPLTKTAQFIKYAYAPFENSLFEEIFYNKPTIECPKKSCDAVALQ